MAGEAALVVVILGADQWRAPGLAQIVTSNFSWGQRLVSFMSLKSIC